MNTRGPHDSSWPIAYLITFSTRGTWLHGDERGSVDRNHSAFGAALVPSDRDRSDRERNLMQGEPVYLDAAERQTVLDAILEVGRQRRWRIHAAHIRTSHVHVVVSAHAKPEKVMVDFKAYATRALSRRSSKSDERARYWTRHGSTRYLWTPEQVSTEVSYVRHEQGTPMAYGEYHPETDASSEPKP